MGILRGCTKFRYSIDAPIQLEKVLKTEFNGVSGFAFIGRSNVGKSSLINNLFGNKTARTSKTPGRTRSINIFEFFLEGENNSHPYLLFDLPGYGFAKVSKEMKRNWNVLMDIFFQFISLDIMIVNLQDARHPFSKVDQEFKDYFKNFNFNQYIIFNKIDKLKTQKERAAFKKEIKKISQKYYKGEQIYCLSSETKEGVDELETGLMSYLHNSSISAN